MGRKIWTCKIGGLNLDELPPEADQPLRIAVRNAYRQLTGREDEFCFSGWGGSLSEVEEKCIEETDDKIHATTQHGDPL